MPGAQGAGDYHAWLVLAAVCATMLAQIGFIALNHHKDKEVACRRIGQVLTGTKAGFDVFRLADGIEEQHALWDNMTENSVMRGLELVLRAIPSTVVKIHGLLVLTAQGHARGFWKYVRAKGAQRTCEACQKGHLRQSRAASQAVGGRPPEPRDPPNPPPRLARLHIRSELIVPLCSLRSHTFAPN